LENFLQTIVIFSLYGVLADFGCYTLSHQMHIINGTFPILCSLVSMDGYWNTLPFLLVVVNFLNLLLG